MDGMVAGLWKGPSALTMDFVNVIRRFRLLGFNSVRLPFSMKASLTLWTTLAWNGACPNDTLQPLPLLEPLNSLLRSPYVLYLFR